MGVPTITMKGSSFLSSVGETIAVNSGHRDLCAKNADKYIELALQLSGDIASLNTNRMQRRSNVMKTPLFDGLGFAKDFERLLEVMIEQGSSNE
jgi:predicted O-linked N-acetylglucosamine transferase (SPINDLY family)